MEGCGIDLENSFGDTALVFACRRGRIDIVRYLLAAGADPHRNSGRALAFSLGRSHLEVAELLYADERVSGNISDRHQWQLDALRDTRAVELARQKEVSEHISQKRTRIVP